MAEIKSELRIGNSADAAAVADPRLLTRIRSRAKSLLLRYGFSVLVVILAIAAWDRAVVWFEIPTFLMPSPLAVAERIGQSWDSLIYHSSATMWAVGTAFFLSLILGVAIAVLLDQSERIEQALLPLLVVSQVIPKVALAPLFLVWLGYGIASKVMVAFLIAFFPVVINSLLGLKSINPEMLALARSVGANRWQILVRFKFPNGLPSLFAGLKTAGAFAVIGALVGEFVGAERGLGYLVLFANGRFDMPLLFAALVFVSILGIAVYSAVGIAERLTIPWYLRKQQGQAQQS